MATKEPPRADGQPLRQVESFDSFYRREMPALVRFTTALVRRRDVAEELAQEAMLRAHARWDQVSSYDDPSAWVRRVAANAAKNVFRRWSIESRTLVRARSWRADEAAEARQGSMAPELWEAVSRLPLQQRSAVALYYLEDRSLEDIAIIIGCSASTARVHLHRGRQQLAQAMGDES